MVVIEQGAKAILFTEIISGDNNDILRDSKLYASVGETASLNYLEIQNLNQHSYHFSNSWVTLMKDANFYSSIANFGSLLTKTRFGCSLQGQGASLLRIGNSTGLRQQGIRLWYVPRHNCTWFCESPMPGSAPDSSLRKKEFSFFAFWPAWPTGSCRWMCR